MASMLVSRQAGLTRQIPAALWFPRGAHQEYQAHRFRLEEALSFLHSLQVQQLGVQVWVWWPRGSHQYQA